MRILILGAGKMGSFFTDILSFQHETAVFDVNPHQLRFVYNTYRFTTLEEIKDFEPELVINAVTVKYTLDAFHKVLPVLPKDCIISDIASVKTGLKKFYEESGFRYVSSHPMFGPTFASLSNLSSENAIIISEGDHLGKIFFKDLYQTLRLNIFEYTFDEHDETVAYSLSIPFVSTFVFAAVMKHQEAPGTTFKKHMAIAKGLLSEDDYLLQEMEITIDIYNQLQSKVEEIELQIHDCVLALAPPILTIPGIGAASAAVILSEFGDLSKFNSPSKLLSFAGMEPGYFQSGTSESTGKMVKHGSSHLRYAMMNCAQTVINNEPTFAAYYAKKRAEGKEHRVALTHVAKKLLRVIYTLQTKELSYNPDLVR